MQTAGKAWPAREEAALLRQGAAVRDDGGGVHLQAVVVVEAERLVADDTRVEPETRLFQPFARTGMAGVENGQVVLRSQCIDGVEKREEVALGVDVLFTVGREEHVLTLLQPEALVDVAGADGVEIGTQHLGHRGTRDVSTLAGQPVVGQVAAGVLGVAEVDVGDDVNDAAVGFLGQTLVLAAVTGLHVEDRDVQPLRRDGRQARVGVAENEQGVGPRLHHELVRAVDDVAHGGAEVVAHGVHVDLGRRQTQVVEEDAVQSVVVVLPCVGQEAVEVAPALVDDGGEADNLGTRANDDKQPQPAVAGKADVGVVSSDSHNGISFQRVQRKCRDGRDRTAHCTR